MNPMEPIETSEQLPGDEHCIIVKCETYEMRKCWIGSRIYYAGFVFWSWRFEIAPTCKSYNWPYTHWLPVSVKELPAMYPIPEDSIS